MELILINELALKFSPLKFLMGIHCYMVVSAYQRHELFNMQLRVFGRYQKTTSNIGLSINLPTILNSLLFLADPSQMELVLSNELALKFSSLKFLIGIHSYVVVSAYQRHELFNVQLRGFGRYQKTTSNVGLTKNLPTISNSPLFLADPSQTKLV